MVHIFLIERSSTSEAPEIPCDILSSFNNFDVPRLFDNEPFIPFFESNKHMCSMSIRASQLFQALATNK